MNLNPNPSPSPSPSPNQEALAAATLAEFAPVVEEAQMALTAATEAAATDPNPLDAPIGTRASAAALREERAAAQRQYVARREALYAETR